MAFENTDAGPFWMSHEEREKRRHDIIIEGQFTKQKLTKKELSDKLLSTGLTVKGKLKDLQRAASNIGLPIEETKQKVIEGWEGKPKGLLQILWERGWIDNSDNKAYLNYTVTGR